MDIEANTMATTSPHADASPPIVRDSLLTLCEGMPDAVFDAIASVTRPIPGPQPAGRTLRYTPLYPQIRQLRHEDDASLPMGEWERPLKKADWYEVAAVASAALRDDSKDFQISAWLGDAWLRLYGLPGLVASLRLMHGLIDAFWESGFPCVVSDVDARSNLFVWFSDAVAATLTTRIALIVFDDASTPPVTLHDWQRMVLAAKPIVSSTPASTSANDAKEAHTTEELRAMLVGPGLLAVHRMVSLLAAASAEWAHLANRLDAKLGPEAPALGRAAQALDALQRAATSLIDGRPLPAAAPLSRNGIDAAETAAAGGAAGTSAPDNGTLAEEDATITVTSALAPSHRHSPERIRNRDEAYALLKLVADYLQRCEPHSPTPYLIRRAISWGPKSLSELMREILEDEGELKRYIAMLGLHADPEGAER